MLRFLFRPSGADRIAFQPDCDDPRGLPENHERRATLDQSGIFHVSPELSERRRRLIRQEIQARRARARNRALLLGFALLALTAVVLGILRGA